MQTDPLVSICVPARNAAPFIVATLQSVLAQTYANWELIVVENGSSDGTREVIEAFIEKTGDPRIQFHVNASPLGMAANWNRSLEFATGKYTKVICADDPLTPGCLAAQVEILEKNPGVVLVSCTRQIISSNGRSLFPRACYRKTGFYPGLGAVRKGLLAGTNTVGDPVAVLFRTEALQKSGLFEPAIIYFTDIDLWLRLLLHGDFFFIAEPLAYYRIHKGSTGKALQEKTVQDFLRVVDRIESASDLRFTRLERAYIAAQVRMKSWARLAIYQLLADR